MHLARLRAQGQLTELRAGDLRFTRAEAAGFLNQVMGLSLSVEDIALLEERTEGWIAGLKLAALALQGTLSMQGHQDVSEFIQAFAGDHRYILDFLVEEVLQRQSAPVRDFLLQTSILNRLTGPLCDAVCSEGTPGSSSGTAVTGQERLEALERGNFFIVPLTDKRRWYRYHHLFAEVLSVHLKAEQPEQLAPLHRRASEWYEQNGSAADAIRHALAAEDFARAADLVERAVPAMRRSRQEATLLGWLQALPDALLRGRPVLSNTYAGVLLARGELDGVEAHLRDAERCLETTADKAGLRERPRARSTGMVVVDEAEFRRLPGSIAVHRAGQALAQGNVAETVKYARRALDLAPQDDHLTRGGAAGLLGLASWTSGDLDGALDLLDEAERLYMSDFSPNVRPIAALKVRVWVAQGRLEQALDWVREQGLSAHDDLSYLREFEHITLARALLARHKSDPADPAILEAMGLLERLLKAADERSFISHHRYLDKRPHCCYCDVLLWTVWHGRALCQAN